jgi:hypothetical protein
MDKSTTCFTGMTCMAFAKEVGKDLTNVISIRRYILFR